MSDEQHPATTSDDLVGRLTRMIAPTGFGSTRSYLANPDGPEAAARISALERQVGVMREALALSRDQFDFLVRLSCGNPIYEVDPVSKKRTRRKLSEVIAAEADAGSKHCRQALATQADGGKP
jgi:hypothetical protein